MGDGRGDSFQCLAGERLGGVGTEEREARQCISLGDGLWSCLGVMAAIGLFQRLPRACQRIALRVNQVFDLQGQLDVPATVKPLASSALVGFELGKLRLPKAQNIGLNAANTGHIANLEVEAVGDHGRINGAIWG